MTTVTLKKTFAALPTVERGKPVKLTGDPKGKNFLYCNGQSVFIRNMQDPSETDVYTEHSKQATVARYSPSGFYIASGDVTGKVRIWDTINPEHILKAEYPVLGSTVFDLDWSPDSQKIVVCGNGHEKFGHVFTMDSGNSIGVILGHSKHLNTCSYRPTRPFRIVTASEDMTVGFYEGPPFKFKRSQNPHTNFVNVARFSREGECVISGGADGKLFKYDGKDLEQLEGVFASHKGGIYDICFSPDNDRVLTVSGDKTAKIFDLSSGDLLTDFVMGSKDWQDMQLGCLWQGDEIITVNGRGHIIYHSLDAPQQPKRIIKGHVRPITSLALSSDRKTIFSCGLDGIIYWDVDTSDNDAISGPGHDNQVSDIVVDGDNLISVGVDDTMRFTSVSASHFSGGAVKLESQPKEVDCVNGMIVVACLNNVGVYEGNRKLSSMPLKSEALSVSIHPGGSSVAVGFKDSKLRIFSLQSGILTEVKEISLPSAVSCVRYSPDGAYLIASSDRRVIVFSASDYSDLMRGEIHLAAVRDLAWSPDSSRFASSGLDSKLVIWENFTEFKSARPSIKAHTMSHGNKLVWIDNHTVASGGQDANIRIFTVSE